MAVRVEIYTRRGCAYCARARVLLEGKGVIYDHLPIDGDPARTAEMVSRAAGRTSVPQIFIDGQPVGGCDELYALDREGRLDVLLQGGSSTQN